jgi:hypothetical protein
MRVQCQACRANFKAPDQYAGRRVKCPRCSAVIELPNVQRAELVSPLEPDPITDMLDEELAAGPAMPRTDFPPRPRARPDRKRVKRNSLPTFVVVVCILSAVLTIFNTAIMVSSPFPGLIVCILTSPWTFAFGAIFTFQYYAIFLRDDSTSLLHLFIPFFPHYFIRRHWKEMRNTFYCSGAAAAPLIFPAMALLLFHADFIGSTGPSRSSRMPIGRSAFDDLSGVRSPTCKSRSSLGHDPRRHRGPMILRRVGGQSNERPLQSTVTPSVCPRSSAPWLVRLEVPSIASESLDSALFGTEPIPIGTSRFVRERAYAPADVGRAVVLHRRAAAS